MLTKSDFLKNFKNSEENLEKLYSLYCIALTTNKFVVVKEFYTFSICNLLGKFGKNLEVGFYSYGFSDDFERCLIAFGVDFRDVSVFDDEAKVLKISYNDKFNKLFHRDFLGSIMSLGFTREKMGDLVLNGNCAYVPVIVDFADYIIHNLKKVRNVPVSVSLELFNRLPQKKFEVLYKVVASLRVDSLVSALTNLSRERSKELVRAGKIKLNGLSCIDIDAKVCENDIVVISGYGKFKIRESLGHTAKNKMKIVIDKFI